MTGCTASADAARQPMRHRSNSSAASTKATASTELLKNRLLSVKLCTSRQISSVRWNTAVGRASVPSCQASAAGDARVMARPAMHKVRSTTAMPPMKPKMPPVASRSR